MFCKLFFYVDKFHVKTIMKISNENVMRGRRKGQVVRFSFFFSNGHNSPAEISVGLPKFRTIIFAISMDLFFTGEQYLLIHYRVPCFHRQISLLFYRGYPANN